MPRLLAAVTLFLILTWGTTFAESDSLQNSIPDANLSKLLVAPTSRSLPEDKGYINLAEIIMPNFGYGITDEFMIRGGFTPFTVSGRVLYFGLAQLQVADYGDLLFSGGILLTDFTGAARKWENALYGYGIVSYGNDVSAIHAGFGGGYSGTRESSSAVFMVGAEWKIARTTKLISENWIVSETGSAALSLGLRIFGKTLTGELGGIIITSNHAFKIESIIPWIGITFIL
ncbi:MAG: hypothetical protein Q8916_12210 [Bacteroidota bacterium]|nr:hypothetical protein [Bacteroidota bacterium]MDP4231156.1 hypothetical protein [Bacteroidota bacterium]MDP4236085.1 hypothetical protein [Bacteroidota bacterium]